MCGGLDSPACRMKHPGAIYLQTCSEGTLPRRLLLLPENTLPGPGFLTPLWWQPPQKLRHQPVSNTPPLALRGMAGYLLWYQSPTSFVA